MKRAARGWWLVLLAPALMAPKRNRQAEVTEPTVAAPAPVAEVVERAPTAAPLFDHGLPVDIGELPEGLANASAQGCAGCHAAVVEAWSSSAHASAWRDADTRAALTSGGVSCTGCHLPVGFQAPMLGPDQANPAWQASLSSEGVSCSACHLRDGAVVGTRGAGAGSHPVRVSDELATGEACKACHQLDEDEVALYDTWGEWSRSPYAEAGVSCVSCHLAPVAAAGTLGGLGVTADHSLGLDPSRAVSVLLELDAPVVVRGEALEAKLLLQGTGAGHAFPTGSPFRQVRVDVLVRDAEGETVGTPWSTLLGRTVSGPPWVVTADQRLQPLGELRFEPSLDLPHAGAGGEGHVVVAFTEVGPDGTHPEPLFEHTVPVSVE